MTQSLDLINEFEEAFEVDKWEINGVHIWPMVRLPLIYSWERYLMYPDGEIDQKFRSINKKIADEASKFFNGLKMLIKNKNISNDFNPDVGIWAYDIDRIPILDRDYSVFSDAFADIEKYNGLKVLSVDLTLKHSYSRFYHGIDITLSHFFNRYIARFNSSIKDTELSFCLSAPKEWCQLKGLPFCELEKRKIVNNYSLMDKLKEQYLLIINRFKLKATMKVCWYGVEGMSLAWASRERGIPCFDLQHGLAGASQSRAYCRWNKLPKDGYKIMPSGYWCWSEDDAKAIEKWSKGNTPEIQTIVGGNLWQRLWIEKKYPENFYDAKLLNAKLLGTDNIKILFTLQDECIPKLLIELLNKSPTNWDWWIRCHPGFLDYIDTIDEQLKQYNNVDTKLNSCSPLPLILQHVDVHITAWSAVVLDANNFGINSIVYHPSAKLLFKDSIDLEDVYYIDNAADIIKIINTSFQKLRSKYSKIKYPSFANVLSKYKHGVQE
jgi:hypothetical protein